MAQYAKRATRLVGTAFFLIGSTAGLATAQNGTQAPKFAYVDSKVILQRAPGSAAIQAQITKELIEIISGAEAL